MERLAQEVNALLGRAEFRAKLEAQGVEPMSRSVAEFNAFVAEDRARWGEVIRRGNIRPDG